MARATVATAIALLLAPLAVPAQGPRFVSPSVRLELGAAISTPYLEDANGATVRASTAPTLALGAAWALGGDRGAPTAATIDARATRSPVSVRQGGSDTPVDPAWQLDVTAGAEHWLGRVGLRAGAGVTWLRGDEKVSPFRFANDSPWHLAAEVGALVRLSATRPLSMLLAAQGYRMGASAGAGPVASNGAVVRVMAAVRYGR